MGGKFSCCFLWDRSRNKDENRDNIEEHQNPASNNKQELAGCPTNVRLMNNQIIPLEIVLMTKSSSSSSTVQVEDNKKSQEQKLYIPVQKPITISNEKEEYHITDNNLDDLISKASNQTNPDTAIRLLEKIIVFIALKQDKTFQLLQKWAYSEVNLANNYALTNNPDYGGHYKNALSIYSKYENEYFQEIVSLLNNWALKDQNEGHTREAIEKYINILKIQEKYYSSHDQRQFLSQNNLACAYCQNNQFKEGHQIFMNLLTKIKSVHNSQISQLIKGNYRYYRQKFA